MKNLITISFNNFTLTLINNGEKVIFPISCAKNGLGEEENSNKTPRGMHKIYKKFGEDAVLGAIFQSRKKTGEICDFQSNNLGDNAILTRIIWLEGIDKENVSTKNRYIYIHGTNH
jgi:hypothetical protein